MLGAPRFVTEYRLTGGRLFHLGTNLDILTSMEKAIQTLELQLQKTPDPLLQVQLLRLGLEKEGMEEVLRLLRTTDTPVIWVSPPGLGLESGESRINYFFTRSGGRVVNYSSVATPNVTALIENFFPELKDSGETTESLVAFLLSHPFSTDITDLPSFTSLVSSINKDTNFSPPGFGIDIYRLLQTDPPKAAKLKQLIAAFYKYETEEKNLSPNQRYFLEVNFLTFLFDKFIKLLLIKQNPQVDDRYLALLMSRTSGCGAGLGSLLNPNPFGGLFNLFFETKQEECPACKKKRKPKKEPPQWTP